MISDEMRELLSTYVDGELRDADAVRVEEWTKRDPELQRELAAYRILRRKLRDWDEAEHGEEPSPLMAARARRRVRAHVAASRAAQGGWLVEITSRPWVVAAALLVSLGGGLLLSMNAVPQGRRDVMVRRGPGDLEVVTLAEFEPDLGSMPTVQAGPVLPVRRVSEYGIDELVHRYARFPRRTQFVMTARAETLREQWLADETRLRPDIKETRSVTMESGAVVALVRGYRAETAEYAGLVRLAAPPVTKLPAVGSVPVGEDAARDASPGAGDPGRIQVETTSIGHAVILLAGEVLSGEKDGSGRTRVVGATSWVGQDNFVPMVWADKIPVPGGTALDLTAQPLVLGPRARKRVLESEGRDEAFLAWLREEFDGRSLPSVIRHRAKERGRVVGALVEELGADAGTRGFAVIANGKVLGVELFANHQLMMEFASRLLSGYALEAGPGQLQLKVGAGRGTVAVEQAERMLTGTPDQTARIEVIPPIFEEGGKLRPSGLERIILRGQDGEILGHGLRLGQRPVQLSLFGK